MPQDIVLFAQIEHSLPVRDTFAQQKREGGDGGKADTLMDRVGGENIHTGGNHGECGGELVENGGLQPYMDGVLFKGKPHLCSLTEK